MNEKKQILLVGRFNPSDTLTGPEKYGKRLLEFLSERNYDVVFLDFFFKDKNVNIWKRLFGEQIVNERPLVIKYGIFRIILFFFKTKPSIVHIINLESFQFVIFFLKYFINFRLLTTFHGLLKKEIEGSFYKRKFNVKLKIKILESLALKLSDKLIFVSKLLEEKFKEEYKIDITRSVIISGGIDEEFFQQAKNKNFNEPYKFIFYDPNPEYVNRGFDQILKSFEKMKSYDFELHVIGKGFKHDKSNTKFRVFYYQPFQKAKLLKFLEDKHFIVKGNAFDSFSIFVVECMASGIIPIVHRDIGMSSIIENGINGFIYKLDNNESLEILFKNLFQGDYDLEKISSNCIKSVESLRWSNILKSYLNIYAK
ncbi:MAG: glycosyltransferase family 4 protein [Ignavibacteria bacterium]|nr:glycosyltransferase family 4 protein [Ignavibacteria bacterium]